MDSHRDTNLASRSIECAYECMNRGDNESAVEHATEALKHDPSNVDALICRGNAFALMGDDPRAIDDCSEAIAIDPNCANAYHNRACAFRGTGNPNQALLDYNRAIELDSTNDKSFAQRASVYLMLHQYGLCVEDASKAFEMNSNLLPALLYRASAYANLGQFENAIKDFTILLEYEGFAFCLFLRATCFIEMARYEEALDDARRIEELFGKSNGPSEYIHGCVYSSYGELKEALAALSEACMDMPKFREAFEKRAAVYELSGDLESAKRDLETAAGLEPRSLFNVTFDRTKTVLC